MRKKCFKKRQLTLQDVNLNIASNFDAFIRLLTEDSLNQLARSIHLSNCNISSKKLSEICEVLEVDEENNLQFLEITDNSFEFKTQGLKSLASLIKYISKQNK